jgi:hypothetical protein
MGAVMTPTTTLPVLLVGTPPVTDTEPGQYPPLSDEARTATEWYASDEFGQLLLAHFQKAVQAAVAENAALGLDIDTPVVVTGSVNEHGQRQAN